MSAYSKHSSRPARGGGRGFSHARGYSGRGRSFGHATRRPGGNRTPHRGQHIDVSRFIHKGTPIADVKPFTPKNRFSDFPIDEALKKNITKKGYATPTPIQDTSIPHTLAGKDVVGIANTGTGKTGAFLIPLVHKILQDRKERVLIMVPTRELALQIEEEFWGFADSLRIGAVSCVGGANINRQISILRRDPHMVIGTPGRLKDLLERRVLNLSRFRTVVLDEADRMLDMGFINDMKEILAHMPKERHTLFFSATLSRDIEMLIKDFLIDPVHISVKTGDTASGVDQDIVRVGAGKTKIDVLHELLIQPELSKVLVFGRTKHGVEKLSKSLAERGFKAESIHGNKNQNRRERALALFKGNHVQVLVATDVAARGIDIDDISHVINFDIPTTYEDYVHRIGRTGRAGKRGKALTFIE